MGGLSQFQIHYQEMAYLLKLQKPVWAFLTNTTQCSVPSCISSVSTSKKLSPEACILCLDFQSSRAMSQIHLSSLQIAQPHCPSMLPNPKAGKLSRTSCFLCSLFQPIFKAYWFLHIIFQSPLCLLSSLIQFPQLQQGVYHSHHQNNHCLECMIPI